MDKLKQNTCPNCGSPDIVKDNYDCSYCGSSFNGKKTMYMTSADKSREHPYYTDIGLQHSLSGLTGIRWNTLNDLQGGYLVPVQNPQKDTGVFGFISGLFGG